MKVKRAFAALLALTMLVGGGGLTSQQTYAATESITVVLDDICTGGSYTTKSVTNGSIIESESRCVHGHNMKHWYDAETGLSGEGGYAYQGSWSGDRCGGPEVKVVKMESTAPTRTMYKASVKNTTGLDITFSISPSYKGGQYIVYGSDIRVGFSCKTHAPIVINGTTYDAYNGSAYVEPGKLVGGLYVSLGTTSGTANAYLKSGTTKSTHAASKCSHGGMVITGEHKDVHTSSGSTTYYDKDGNAIGGSGYTSHKCSACGASWGGGGGSINSDYEGDVYDENGHKTGYVTGSSSNGNYYGTDFTYLKGGYSYSSGNSASAGTACFTATISTCTTHNYMGEHYYCNTHGYVGESSTCTYCTSGGSYSNATYNYEGNSPTFPAFKNTIVTDSTCSAYPNYLSIVPGKSVIVNMTNYPGVYRYTVKNDAGVLVKGGTSSESTFSYTMPTSNVTVNIEQGLAVSFAQTSYSVEKGTTVLAQATASPSSATISYSSNNTNVASVNASSGVVTGNGAGSCTITATAVI